MHFMANDEACDLLGFAVADIRRYHKGELTGELTEEDVFENIRSVLWRLIGSRPTDEDCQVILTY